MESASREMAIYVEALTIARDYKQTVGEKNDYYITLAQLERLLRRGKRET